LQASEVQQTGLDLLFESAQSIPELIHLELQSTNHPQLPLRMAEYSLRVYRKFQRFRRQIVLYVGDAKMRMPAELVSNNRV